MRIKPVFKKVLAALTTLLLIAAIVVPVMPVDFHLGFSNLFTKNVVSADAASDAYWFPFGGTGTGNWTTHNNWADYYTVGTADFHNGDATVEGAGGLDWSAYDNQFIRVATTGKWYTIDSITDADTLELSAAFAEADTGAVAYALAIPGHAEPTVTNDALFNIGSFTGAGQVVTVDATASCLDMVWTGATNTPTLAGSSILNISGALTFIAAMVQSYSGEIHFKATAGSHNITTALTLAGSLNWNGVGGTWVLQDAVNIGTRGFSVLNGTINTNGQTVSCGGFALGNAAIRTLTLGASIVNCTSVTNTATTNLTITANTATINVTGTGAVALGTADWGDADFNLNGTAHTVSGSPTNVGVFTRNGTATNANTLTMTSGTTLTCTTFAMIGNSRANQLLVQSSTLGSAATIHAGNWTGTNNADLMDITSTDAVDFSAAGLNILTIGNAGGNTGITFPAAVAHVSAAAGNWSHTAEWDVATIPLPQDDVTCSHNMAVDMPRMGKSITFTGTPTVSLSNAITFYGSFVIPSGATFATTQNIISAGRGSFTFTSNTKSIRKFTLNAPTGTMTLSDSMTTTSGVEVFYGTFTLNNFNITTSDWAFAGSGTRVLNLGSGTVTLNYAGVATKWSVSGSNYTLNSGTSTIICTESTADAQTFAGGGQTYNNVTVQGTGNYALTITGNNVFNTFKVNASDAPKTIVATGTTQVVNNFQRGSAIGTNVVTMTGGTWSKFGARLVSGTGTFTGSPINLVSAANTVVCTIAGTATITLPAGMTGTAETGTMTVDLSPVALIAGANTITTSGVVGNITVTIVPLNTVPIALDYLAITGSTAVPANVWYAGETPAHSTDGGGNTGWVFTQVNLAGLVTTNATTGVTMNAAGVTGGTFNGTIGTIDGTPTITTRFEYGLTAPAYGLVTADIVVYASGAFTGTIPNNLTPGATYHYRAVITNSVGTVNGADGTFVFTMPTVATVSATDVTINGSLVTMGKSSSTYVSFLWGYSATGLDYSTDDETKVGVSTFNVDLRFEDHFKSSRVVYYKALARVGSVYSSGTVSSFQTYSGTDQIIRIVPLLLAGALIIELLFGGYYIYRKRQDLAEVSLILMLICVGIAVTGIGLLVILAVI
jgi:hypothetical protein